MVGLLQRIHPDRKGLSVSYFSTPYGRAVAAKGELFVDAGIYAYAGRRYCFPLFEPVCGYLSGGMKREMIFG